MRASQASEELARLPGLGVFGSYSMLYRAVCLMSVGWFSRERRACSLVARSSLPGSSEGKQLPMGEGTGSQAQCQAGGGSGLTEGADTQHPREARGAGPGSARVPVVKRVDSDWASPDWICASGSGSARYLVRHGCGRAQVGLSGASPVRRRRAPAWGRAVWGKPPLRLPFQHLPCSSSCPWAGPRHHEPSSCKGSVLGTLALEPSQRAFLAFLEGLVFSPVRFLSVGDAAGIHVPFWGFNFIIRTLS